MIIPGSRYETAEHLFTNAHIYNPRGYPILEGEVGRSSLQVSVVSRDTLYLDIPIPPTPPLEYFAKETENMPFQAYKFLGDSTRWWEVAAVNPQIWYPLDMKPGSYMRIPI